MSNLKFNNTMKNLICTLLSSLISLLSFGQPMDSLINWKISVEKINNSHANLVFTAQIHEGYHLFSLRQDTSIALVPRFKFEKSSNFKKVGEPFEMGEAIKHNDILGTLFYFEKKAIFKQKIEVLSNQDFEVDFTIESIQLCNEIGCVAPYDFKNKISVKGFVPSNKKAEESNFFIFIAGFLAGLAALLTPCMFPMVPITVTYFTRHSVSRKEAIMKASTYGLSIILIYVLLGVIFTAATGPLGLNDLSTNIWMNLIFFGIFVVFAFSFLGAFDIRMPSKLINKMDNLSNKSGIVGIFFMAFTLGLVSFSCTGPIIGSLLVEAAASGTYFTPAIGMVGFSMALAIPFTIFAIFPGWLSSLPTSGGWLNSVKVVLGLLELALALKFLSSVDLAYHWGFLTREWFVAIWFVLFLIMGVYLLGKISFTHDTPPERISVPRFMFASTALVFAVYLLPGMFGAPLKLIDGIAPPRTHSEDNFRFVNGGLETGGSNDSISQKYRSEMHPVGDGSVLVFHDLKTATKYAREKNLPILLDFTGHACQNCRKMESSVWTNDEIRPLLQNKFVIASLYCDDRTPLPANEVHYSEIAQRQVKNVGNKWAELQIKKYKSFQQPLYVIIDHEGRDLTEAIGYTPNIKSYKTFLLKGIREFDKQ
jgi:cytochrome c biogenesis protein CcdA/thioredoxin-related protein